MISDLQINTILHKNQSGLVLWITHVPLEQYDYLLLSMFSFYRGPPRSPSRSATPVDVLHAKNPPCARGLLCLPLFRFWFSYLLLTAVRCFTAMIVVRNSTNSQFPGSEQSH